MRRFFLLASVALATVLVWSGFVEAQQSFGGGGAGGTSFGGGAGGTGFGGGQGGGGSFSGGGASGGTGNTSISVDGFSGRAAVSGGQAGSMRGGTSQGGINTSNPFQAYYGYPRASGLGNSQIFQTNTITFGSPVADSQLGTGNASASAGGSRFSTTNSSSAASRNSGTSRGGTSSFGGSTGTFGGSTGTFGSTNRTSGGTGQFGSTTRSGTSQFGTGTGRTSQFGTTGFGGGTQLSGNRLTSTGTGRPTGAFNSGGQANIFGTNANASQVGNSSIGPVRASFYATELGFDRPARTNLSARSDLQTVLSQSTRFSSTGNSGVRVLADGDTIVLRGRVRTEKDKRIAEGLLRLTPGVRELKNEIEVEEDDTRN